MIICAYLQLLILIIWMKPEAKEQPSETVHLQNVAIKYNISTTNYMTPKKIHTMLHNIPLQLQLL